MMNLRGSFRFLIIFAYFQYVVLGLAYGTLHGVGTCDQCHDAPTLDAIRAGEHKLAFEKQPNIHKPLCSNCHNVEQTCTQCHELPPIISADGGVVITIGGTGYLSVSSTPSGADVYLDGIYQGTTPLIISDVSVGYHNVKITKFGYQDYQTEVYVRDGETTYVTATLKSEISTLQIVSEPFGASVYIDDIYVGKTPITVKVSPGSHTLKLIKSGYDEVVREIYVEAGGLRSVELTLTKSVNLQFTNLKSKVENRIISAQRLLTDLHNLVSAGKNIGADVSEAEVRINNAAQLLKEANDSYSTALQKLNQGDITGAINSANDAYTKGTSGMTMLEESKPILQSSISEKLNNKLSDAESLVNMAGSIGLSFGTDNVLNQAKNEIDKFNRAFDSGDLSKASEYVLNADRLLNEVRMRIYAFFGGIAAILCVLAFGIVKVRDKLPKSRSPADTNTRKVAAVSDTAKPMYDTSIKAITIKNLTKRYKNATILENVGFEIEQGKLVAIVGPSGAGKSTIIEAVAGRLTPDEGEIHILGMDASRERMEINRLVGFVPQHPEIYMDQKVWQNMMNSATKWEVKNAEAKAEEILKQLGIYERRDIPAKNLSGGQLKRLSLAMELIREPPILVLDEPTTGLDPTSRDQIITALSKMVFNQGKTCIFTTHFMDEAEHCDEVIIVGDKRIIAKGSPSELAKRMPGMGRIVEITLEEVKEELVDKLKEERGIHTVIREGRVLKVVMDSPDAVEVSQKIKSLGGVIEGARVTKAGMKEVFVHYTGMLPEEGQ